MCSISFSHCERVLRRVGASYLGAALSCCWIGIGGPILFGAGGGGSLLPSDRLCPGLSSGFSCCSGLAFEACPEASSRACGGDLRGLRFCTQLLRIQDEIG